MSNTDLLSSDTAAGTSDKSQVAGSNGGAPRRRAGLSGMVLAELRELAGTLGITGTTGMRKGDLINAIKERQGGSTGGTADTLPLDNLPAVKQPRSAKSPKPAIDKTPAAEKSAKAEKPAADEEQAPTRTRRRRAGRPAGSPDAEAKPAEVKAEPKTEPAAESKPEPQAGREERQERQQGERQGRDRRERNNDRGERGERGNRNDRGDRNDRGQGRQNQDQSNAQDDEDDDERGGRRGRRFRDRRRRGRGEGGTGGGGADTEVREDDVLLPVAGVLDVLENYAFVRTSGYLAGPNDVYVSLSLVRRYGLRRGDAITGLVRQPREGEQQRQKFNPLVRVETVNGMDPEQAKTRPEFTKLTPLYPNERLRLETEPHILSTRVIDLVMPVGKGQRALIVSPPKAGKTTVLQQIANAIAKNNPECYLMVVLVDERPEEVTDMQRSVDGEVIAATFDRPPSDHTMLAELAIERAKRLVEMGTDVVVLLDSVTRLGRAYNLAAPASGRILSGGVDSTALYPPKRFLGAARNIENGGSLTIFATALVETGSAGDSVIFEEFKGTGNAELKLDRKIADKRTFPAVDVDQSSTRKEDLLLSPDELAVTHKLRRVLHALEPQAAIELLLDRLRKTRTNIEFLMQVAKTTPGADND
ncbi:transcription termination factor Rho [Kibdelosporangium aridum]|uniref:Transcription termination factor Rho n=1 Tax=Kibdelosporangium aridum TaxID=2030 RepID=A0A428Z6H9_KIBAR|nr:transcription termination factor Rho [Kibdelosporangium aridum]RSM82765.1 transcription termination factor Rho [Kibdelosporangium aridum]